MELLQVTVGTGAALPLCLLQEEGMSLYEVVCVSGGRNVAV
jgi:hypothetical protein